MRLRRTAGRHCCQDRRKNERSRRSRIRGRSRRRSRIECLSRLCQDICI